MSICSDFDFCPECYRDGEIVPADTYVNEEIGTVCSSCAALYLEEIQTGGEDVKQASKAFDILVNGKQISERRESLRALDLAELAFPQDRPARLLTVTYRRGPRKNPEGMLMASERVWITHGMIFNVADTGAA